MKNHRHHNIAIAVAMAALASSPWRVMNKAGGVPDLQAEHWYDIRAAGEGQAKTIQIFIYGEIGNWGVTSGDFIRDLQAQDDGVSPVLVRFDTIGGDLFDGIAIHNTLRGLGERCTSRIDGACWSSGSIAACGAHRVEMADNALMMIHDPWVDWMSGGSDDLRKMADMLDKAREGILASYQHRPLTIDEAELNRLVKEETWLTPAEAKAAGFVDEVIGSGSSLGRNAGSAKILNRYRNAPEAAQRFLAQREEPEEPAADPVPDDEPDSNDNPDDAPDMVALATLATAECASAGIANHSEHIIKASGLKSESAVRAAIKRAKDIKQLCILAKQPTMADDLITIGSTVDQARAKLFDKLVANSGKVEISNHPSVDDQPAPSAKAVNPGDVYAKRRNQQQAASKGART